MREYLKDAGCDQKLIDSFESMCGQENRARLSLLISYRLLLLDIIHAEQKKAGLSGLSDFCDQSKVRREF